MGRLLKLQIVAMVLLPLLFGGAGYHLTQVAVAPEFTSTATVVVRGTNSNSEDMQYEDVLASQTLAKMVVSVAQSREIAAEVSATFNDPTITPDRLMDSVKVTLLPDSSIVSIQYIDSQAERSARVANKYIDILEAEVPVYYKGAILTRLDYAVAPERPLKTNSVLNTLAAALAGLAFAMILAYMLANRTYYR